jgi:hypothetical protein
MNKKTRLILLVALTVIALFAAVVPALAQTDYYVLSFERDADGDGEPDYWNIRGAAEWVCFDRWLYEGHCGVVFYPSRGNSVVYMGMTEAGFTTNGEEGIPDIADVAVIAKGLDANRAFVGYMFEATNGDRLKIYGGLPGGTYKGWYNINGMINQTGPGGELRAVFMGMVVVEGDGRILIDFFDPDLPL